MQSMLRAFYQKLNFKHFVDAICLFWVGRYLYELVIFIQKPITELIGFVPDDTFYYLKIVENAHNLQFISFDGLNLTSGFHYLHFAFLYLLYFFQPSKELFVLLACLVSALAFVGAVAVLWWRLRKRNYHFAALVFFSTLLLSDVEKVTFMGLEVGLAALLFALVFNKFEQSLHALHTKSYQLLPTFGSLFLVALFAMLSRSDFILVLFGFSSMYWLLTIRTSAVSSYTWIKATVLAFLAHSAITYAISRHLTQDSGAVKLALRSIWRTLGVETWSLSIFSDLNMVLLHTVEFITKHNFAILITVFSVVIVAMLVQAIIRSRFNLFPVIKENILALTLVLLFLVIATVYQVVFAQVQVWYMLIPSLILILSSALLLEQAVSPFSRNLYVKIIAVVVTISCCVASVYVLNPSGAMYPWQADMYHKAFALKALYGKEISGRIGIWNAGIIGYFSDLPIINIDGLVNGSVRNVLVTQKKGAMVDEIKREDIRYLADWNGVFQRSLVSFYLGEEFLKNQLVKIDAWDQQVPFSLYQVR